MLAPWEAAVLPLDFSYAMASLALTLPSPLVSAVSKLLARFVSELEVVLSDELASFAAEVN